jgi:hypothetical protein
MRIDIYDSPGSDSDQYRDALETQCAALGISVDIGAPQAGTTAKLTVIFANRASRWTGLQEQTLEQLVLAFGK